MKRQQGTVLIMGLVMLATLTMVGVTALQTGMIEEKLSGNMRDQYRSFHAAGSALRDGEDWLLGQESEPESQQSCAGVADCVWQEGSINLFDGASTSSDFDTHAIEGSQLEDVADNPKYLTELSDYLPDDKDPDTRARRIGRVSYKITSEGKGKGAATRTFLQSGYTTRFN